MSKVVWKRGVIIFIGWLLLGNANAGALKPITLYTYHLMPPYLVDVESKKGLFFDFAELLNSRTSQYQFQVQYLPRKRLERLLEADKLNGVVLGVSPTWFADKSETKYLWTAKIISDQDEIVSLKNSPIDYDGPESLTNTRIGGVLGFYYYGIDELVEKGKIIRIDTTTEFSLLSMILSKRVDSGIISRATLNYLVPRHQWQGKFYISKHPHDRFDRRVMVPKRFHAEFTFLQSVLIHIDSDSEWQSILTSYQ